MAIKYKIKYRCYEITGAEIIRHTPQKICKTYKNLIIVAYQNHMYPIKNREIIKMLQKGIKIKSMPSEIILIDSVVHKITSILSNGYMPIIFNNGIVMIAVIHKDVLYVDNEEYFKCHEILKKLNLLLQQLSCLFASSLIVILPRFSA